MIWDEGKPWHQEIMDIQDTTVQVQKVYTPSVGRHSGEPQVHRYMWNGHKTRPHGYLVFTSLEDDRSSHTLPL